MYDALGLSSSIPVLDQVLTFVKATSQSKFKGEQFSSG
jgi:hypothetical protein